jgi:hypothetical protein
VPSLVFGLALTHAGQPVLYGFLAILRLALDRFQGPDSEPIVRELGVRSVVGGDEPLVHALTEVPQREAPFLQGGTPMGYWTSIRVYDFNWNEQMAPAEVEREVVLDLSVTTAKQRGSLISRSSKLNQRKCYATLNSGTTDSRSRLLQLLQSLSCRPRPSWN